MCAHILRDSCGTVMYEDAFIRFIMAKSGYIIILLISIQQSSYEIAVLSLSPADR